MEFLGDVAAGLFGAASGGIFGFLGSVVGGVFKFLHAKEERAALREERAYELELLEAQAKVSQIETENELKVVAQEGSWNAMRETHRADAVAVRKAPAWAAGVRALFRPLLTTLLLGASVAAFVLLVQAFDSRLGLMATLFTAEQQLELLRYMIYTLFFSTSTAVVWWYGDRAFAPPGMKNR